MRRALDAIYADCMRSLDSCGTRQLESLRGGKILVTGATGFVGTWLLALCAYLNDHHDFRLRVCGVSRRPSRLGDTAPFLASRRDIELAHADVRQLVEFPADTEWVIHAAANPDSRHHATDPVDTASVIADGTSRVLRLAEQAEGLKRVLHFSSGLVHEAALNGDGHRVAATAVYREAKRFSEALCAAFRTQSRLPIVVTRPFTFLGPFQALEAPWAANNFLRSAMNDQPLKLLGDGETVRTYLYGSDMAVLALHQLVQGKTGETFDLGATDPIRLIELAEMVVSEAGKPLEIRRNTGGKPIAAAPLVPEENRSLQAFGFVPAFSAREAIARTLAWHRRT